MSLTRIYGFVAKPKRSGSKGLGLIGSGLRILNPSWQSRLKCEGKAAAPMKNAAGCMQGPESVVIL